MGGAFAEPGAGPGFSAPPVAAIRREVEIPFENLIFAQFLLGLERTKGLDGLARPGAWAFIGNPAELHGQGTGAGHPAAGQEVIADGPQGGQRINAEMLVEAAILGRQRGLLQVLIELIHRQPELPVVISTEIFPENGAITRLNPQTAAVLAKALPLFPGKGKDG